MILFYTEKEGGEWKPLKVDLKKIPDYHVGYFIECLKENYSPDTKMSCIKIGETVIDVQSVIFKDDFIWDSRFCGQRPIGGFGTYFDLLKNFIKINHTVLRTTHETQYCYVIATSVAYYSGPEPKTEDEIWNMYVDDLINFSNE